MNFPRCTIRGWIASSGVMAACLIVAGHGQQSVDERVRDTLHAVPNALRCTPSMVPATQTPPWPLAVALDLCETGVVLMRQTLRRQFPDANDQDIDRRLQAWLRHRPGAELGDAPGRALDSATRFP